MCRAFFRLAGLYDACMGMKLAKIQYHLERAAIARADDAAGRPVNIGAHAWGKTHLARAEYHESLAAGYLVAGLQEYARRADNPAARRARAWRRRQQPGPGRGVRNRGKLFGRQLKD